MVEAIVGCIQRLTPDEVTSKGRVCLGISTETEKTRDGQVRIS